MQIQCKFRLKQLQRERDISSWAGVEKFCNGLEFRRKNGIFCCEWSRTLPHRNDQPWLPLMKGVTVAIVTQLNLKIHWKNKQTPKHSEIHGRSVFFIHFRSLNKRLDSTFFSFRRSQSLLFSMVACKTNPALLSTKVTRQLWHVN